MFFESRVHTLRKVAGPKEAAELIKGGKLLSYEVLYWQGANHEMYCVNDASIYQPPFLEIVLLHKEIDGTFTQVESITAGWIDRKDILSQYLVESESTSPYKTVHLIINEPKDNQEGTFTCACCGATFTGNVETQITYCQEPGYGLCNKCV